MKGIQHIQNVFQHQKAYIAYLTAGDGGLQRTRDAALSLIEGGVNILELGVPFSDPIADGPVIQRAMHRAVEANVTVEQVIQLAAEIKKATGVPIVLFSYLNPLLHYFNHPDLKDIDACLLVDCPLEESQDYIKILNQKEVAAIQVIAPSSSKERIQAITQKAQGFIYYACRKGTTGIKSDLPEDFADKIREIKALTTTPVIAGFGISSKATAQKVLEVADGFVVGSLFVKAVEEGKSHAELRQLAQSINPLA